VIHGGEAGNIDFRPFDGPGSESLKVMVKLIQPVLPVKVVGPTCSRAYSLVVRQSVSKKVKSHSDNWFMVGMMGVISSARIS
jgi:hypothetical protein